MLYEASIVTVYGASIVTGDTENRIFVLNKLKIPQLGDADNMSHPHKVSKYLKLQIIFEKRILEQVWASTLQLCFSELPTLRSTEVLFKKPFCPCCVIPRLIWHAKLIFRSTSAEDMQEKYIRVLGTSLLSYGLFIEQLVLLEGNKKMKALEKAGNMHSNILKDPKFWKLAHHNNLTVRKSFRCVEYAKMLQNSSAYFAQCLKITQKVAFNIASEASYV